MTGRPLPRATRTAAIAVGVFIVLAAPKAAFGVAWTEAAGDLGRAPGDLSLIVAVFVAGYLGGSLSVDRWVARFGTAPILLAAASISTIAIAGYAVAEAWAFLAVSALVLGYGGGLLDVAVNAYAAIHWSARVMNWLHAGFGIGAALGPLLITGLFAIDAGCRIGFWGIAALQLLVLVALVTTRHDWDGPTPEETKSGTVRAQPVVILTLLTFVFYVGLEVAAVQWAPTLLTEGRGLSKEVAGLTVTGLMVAYTGTRMVLGVVGNRFSPVRTATVSAVATVGLTALLWWSPAVWVGPVALIALGAALGPVFPMQTLLTPRRVGAAATKRMVGYQLAASSGGAIAINGGLGPLIDWQGVAIVAPVLTLTAVCLAIVSVAVGRLTRD